MTVQSLPKPSIAVVFDGRAVAMGLAESLEVAFEVSSARGVDTPMPGPELELVLLPVEHPDEIRGDLAAVRANPRLADVPVVVVGARYDPEVEYRALMAGASEFLPRGAHATTLRSRLTGRIEAERYRRTRRPAGEDGISETASSEAGRALREAEARLAALIEHLPHSFGLKEPGGRYIMVNSANALTSRFGAEEIQGKHARDLFPPEYAQIVEEDERQVVATGQVLEREIEVPFPDPDQPRILHWIVFPIRDDAGALIALGRISTDITARRQTEDALRESEARFRAFFDHSPHPMCIQHADGRPLLDNPAVARLYELELGEDELIDSRHSWTQESRAEVDAAIQRIGAERSVSEYELALDVSAQRKYVQVTKFPILDGDGQLVCLGAIGSDVTERKKSEVALRQSHQRFVDFAEASSDWFWELGPDLELLSVVGKSESPVSADTMANLLSSRLSREGSEPVSSPGRWHAFWAKLRNHERIRNFEALLEDDAGEVRHVRISAKVVVDDAGRFAGYRGVGSDITDAVRDRRQAEMLREAVNASGDGVLLYDEQERVLFTSRRFHEIFDSLPSQGDLSGMPRDELLRAIGISGVLETHGQNGDDVGSGVADRTALSAGKALSSSEVAYANGRTYLRRYALAGDGGMLVQLSDISELKRAQEELRRLASELSLAEERERRRIAVELHDGAVQNLGLARIRIGTLMRKLGAHAVAQELDELRELMARSVRELRSLMSDLSPPMLYEQGLPPALEWLAGKFAERFDLDCSLSLPDEQARSSSDLDVLLFQSARELLMNVVKHAEARRVEVGLDYTERGIEMRVRDDGVGIAPGRLEHQPSDTGGFGLFSVRERVELAGGSMRIESARPGTRITVQIPTHE